MKSIIMRIIVAAAIGLSGAWACGGSGSTAAGTSDGGGNTSADAGASSNGGSGCPASAGCQTCLKANCSSQLDGLSEEGEAKIDFDTVSSCICNHTQPTAGDCEGQATAQLYFPVQICAKAQCPVCGF